MNVARALCRRRAVLAGSVLGLVVLAAAACSGSGHGRAHPVFFGVDVPRASPARIAALAAEVGKRPSVVALFVKLDSAVPADQLATIARAGRTPFVTLEPWAQNMKPHVDVTSPQYSLRTLIDGSHNAQLRRIAHQLAAFGRPLYLRFAHEMNANWYPWGEAVNGNRPGQYVAAWRHVHDVMAPIVGDRVRWVWSPNIANGKTGTHILLHELYPGDRYVDYVGLTGYAHGARSAASTFGPTVDGLKTITAKPILLSEIGVEGSEAEKADWLRSLGTYIESEPRIRGFVYFDTSRETTGASGEYRIDGSAAYTKALRQTLDVLGVE